MVPVQWVVYLQTYLGKEARSARNGPKVWLHCTHIKKKTEDINGNVFIEASCNSSYLAVWLRITSLSFRIKSFKDLQRASSIRSSRPKFSLYPVILMVIFGIPHPVHTFNPESRPFYFKIRIQAFKYGRSRIPKILPGTAPSLVVKVVTSARIFCTESSLYSFCRQKQLVWLAKGTQSYNGLCKASFLPTILTSVPPLRAKQNYRNLEKSINRGQFRPIQLNSKLVWVGSVSALYIY